MKCRAHNILRQNNGDHNSKSVYKVHYLLCAQKNYNFSNKTCLFLHLLNLGLHTFVVSNNIMVMALLVGSCIEFQVQHILGKILKN